MTFTLQDYLCELHTGQWFDFNGEHTYANLIIHSDDAKPTEQECTDGVAALQAAYDGNAYKRTRAAAYEEVKEQLDQLYHDMTAGKLDATGEWHKAIKAVKDATPKP